MENLVEVVRKAIIYVRVSTIEQKDNGYSTEAQLKMLRKYAEENGLQVVEEFVEAMTAKETGRREFGRMMAFLKANPDCRTILVEKSDRLARNDVDKVFLSLLKPTIHFVRDHQVISPDSGPADILHNDMNHTLAKYYSLNLSSEVKKGFREKMEQGLWPSKPPLGYKTVVGPAGKRIIVPDPLIAPKILALFEAFSTGNYSIKSLRKKVKWIFADAKKGVVSPAVIHRIMRNPVYTGKAFIFNGKTYQANHLPIVPVGLFQKVQEILDSRNRTKYKNEGTRFFAYKSTMSCSVCGCSVVAEAKKGHVYYRCSGARGRHKLPYTREEAFDNLLADILGRIKLSPAIAGLMLDAFKERQAFKDQGTIRQITDLERTLKTFDKKFDVLVGLLAEGTMTKPDFDQKMEDWKQTKTEATKALETAKEAKGKGPVLKFPLVEFPTTGPSTYAGQFMEVKNRLFKLMVKSAKWDGGKLWLELRQPFNALIAPTVELPLKKAS